MKSRSDTVVDYLQLLWFLAFVDIANRVVKNSWFCWKKVIL